MPEITQEKFKCPSCGKLLKTQFGYNSHIKTHTKDKNKTAEEIKSMPVLKVDSPEPQELTWVKKNGTKKNGKPVRTSCFVVDKNNVWYNNVPVELGDMNTAPFTWGYYGVRRPLLREVANNKLEPCYIQMDIVGESCNRLYKAGHPDGFKGTFKHTSSLLQKVQIGLMVIIVIAIFVLIYAMAS